MKIINKKIVNLAETLFSTTQILNGYCQNNHGEDIYIIKGCIKQIAETSDDLFYQLTNNE